MPASSIRLFAPLLFLVLLVFPAQAAPADAVVQIPSHGGSGTVIATGQGWSLILSCAHAFQGNNRLKPIALVVPVPVATGDHHVGVSLIAVDAAADLSLIRLAAGPLPYVCPVAIAPVTGQALSVGYDEMRLPPQKAAAQVISQGGSMTYTRQAPWHGRSGGALIISGQLVGVVSGYHFESHCPYRFGTAAYKGWVEANATGDYVSLSAIRSFLARYNPASGVTPQRQYYQPPQTYRAAPACPQGRG